MRFFANLAFGHVSLFDASPQDWGRAAFKLIDGPAHGLIAWAASLSVLSAAFVAAFALTAAVIGARRPALRLVAAVVGLLLGFGYVARFGPWLHFLHLPIRSLTWTLGGAFALFGALSPEGLAFAVGGITVGSSVAALFGFENRTLAFFPSFFVGGAAAVMVFPILAAIIASFGGGLLCAVAVAALLPRATLGGYLLTHAALTVGIGLAIGLAGFIGQLVSKEEDRIERSSKGAAKAAKKAAKPANAQGRA